MSTEEQILEAAAEILERDGVAALTTRAVCQAAGVTAPTLDLAGAPEGLDGNLRLGVEHSEFRWIGDAGEVPGLPPWLIRDLQIASATK
jgi:hypothetical protein